MKAKLTTILFFLYTIGFSQNYKTLVSDADTFYKNKEYQKSVEKYTEAFKIEQKSSADFYNAACSAALSGKKEMAFNWLQLALNNGWSNVSHLKTDTDLDALHNDKKWLPLVNEMQKIDDKIEAKLDKPLQAKLLTIFEDDQSIRRAFIKAQNEYGHLSKIVDSLRKIMIYKDSINLIKVTEILDNNGWVGADKVGGQANHTLFLVIQHSDLPTQKKYLPMMREAVKNQNSSSSALALLEDRVALSEGKKQIYGSQIGFNIETNTNYVLPLEDPDNVDQRRASVGLGLLADYVKNWKIVWNVEEYKKQLPELEAKRKK